MIFLLADSFVDLSGFKNLKGLFNHYVF